MDEFVLMGIHIVWMVVAIFPYLCFGKKSHSWSNTKCRPGTDASWNSLKLLDTEEGSDRKLSSFGMMTLWTIGCPDGISHRLDGCCLTGERPDGIPRR